jgi:hypothetical protein
LNLHGCEVEEQAVAYENSVLTLMVSVMSVLVSIAVTAGIRRLPPELTA